MPSVENLGYGWAMAINLREELFKLAKVVHPLLLWVSGGRVGARVAGMPVVILTTTGRKTGKPRSPRSPPSSTTATPT